MEHNLVNAPEFLNYRVIRVSLLWRLHTSWNTFGERWKSIVGVSWKDWIEQCDLISTILILDEAQLIYAKEKKVDQNNMESANQFWMIVKSALQEMANIKIIMFAAYGYRSSNRIGFTTPVALPESNCKSLIDINFKRDELKRYIEKFCGNYFKNLDLPSVSKLYKYIWVVTKGHAGLIRHVLMSTENAMKKRIDTNHLYWDEIFKYLNSKDFDSSIYNNCRAVPKVSALSNEQISLCEDVYLNEKFFYPDSDENAMYLVRSGILIIEDCIYLSFAAPLLKRSFFQQNYGVQNSTDSTPTDLHHFIVKIFTVICNELSGKILRDTLGFGSDGRILEQTWQKEFYRIGTQVLGKGHFLSCDVEKRYWSRSRLKGGSPPALNPSQSKDDGSISLLNITTKFPTPRLR
ncbi:8356_t:CDS:2, partial [Acaulospora morrowiae]